MNSGNIPAESGIIKGDKSADDRENAAQDNLNYDSHAEEGQSQDIDTQQDSAYWSENSTDTLNERSESTALDDTEKDPDFDVEKEQQKNSDITITADETNPDVEEEENAEVTPIVAKKAKNKRGQKKLVNKKPASKYDPVNDDEADDNFYYHCDKCSQKFTDWKQLQKHKIDCVKVP